MDRFRIKGGYPENRKNTKMKSLLKPIILIVTKNDPIRAKNLLFSIKENKELHNSDLIIIDDSDKNKSIFELEKYLIKNDFNHLIHLHKDNWEEIKENIGKHLTRKQDKKMLKELVLGLNCWNVHNARNIGQIITSILYDKERVILSLDGDMVIPKTFKINSKCFEQPKGILLKGSPDLSRLEWIRLYISLKLKTEEKDYSYLLIKNCGRDHMSAALNKFTSLPQITNERLNNAMIYPEREELNNGSYINLVKNFTHSMYPSWYDSDWFWFQRLRRKIEYTPEFIDSPTIHNSYKKSILISETLRFEEEGKIITTILSKKKKGRIPNKKEIICESRIRITSLEKDIEKLRKIKDSSKEHRKIIEELFYLINYLKNISTKKTIEKISSYEKKDKEWHDFLMNLKENGKLKNYLFKALNLRKITIFSPHCDDVVFSMGGGILEGYWKNAKIIDVFTKTNYTLEERGDSNKISSIRKKEEKETFNKLNIKPIFLGLKDATLREYSSEEEYMAPKNNPKKDSAYPFAKNKIDRIVLNNPKDIFLFPLGLGYNIDHTILFKLGMDLSDKGFLVLFYEDCGYKMTQNEKLIKKYLKTREVNLDNRIFYFDKIEEKVNLAKKYKTQISKEILKSLVKVYKKLKGERIWGTEKTFSKINL